MNEYDIIIRYANDGGSEVEHATEATIGEYIHRCLSYPSVERFEVVKAGYPNSAKTLKEAAR